MKKGWKIFAIICAVLAGLGVVLCIAGFAIGVTDEDVRGAVHRGIGFITDDDDDDNDDFDNRTLQSAKTVKEGEFPNAKGIDVEVNKVKVEVVATDENVIRVKNATDEEAGIVIREEGSTLEIETSRRGNRTDNGGTLTIYVPRNMKLTEANVQVNEGAIDLSEIQANELELSVERGEITAADFTVGELSVSCGQGAANIKGTAQADIDLECGVAAINLETKGAQTDYNYEIEVGAGEVNLGGQTFSGLAVEKTINNHAGKEMGIDCATGKVNVTFVQ